MRDRGGRVKEGEREDRNRVSLFPIAWHARAPTSGGACGSRSDLHVFKAVPVIPAMKDMHGREKRIDASELVTVCSSNRSSAAA